MHGLQSILKNETLTNMGQKVQFNNPCELHVNSVGAINWTCSTGLSAGHTTGSLHFFQLLKIASSLH